MKHRQYQKLCTQYFEVMCYIEHIRKYDLQGMPSGRNYEPAMAEAERLWGRILNYAEEKDHPLYWLMTNIDIQMEDMK